MQLKAIIFDLDDTLMPDVPADAEALQAASQIVRARYGIDAKAFAQSARRCANELWQNSPTYHYCLTMGISAAEALW